MTPAAGSSSIRCWTRSPKAPAPPRCRGRGPIHFPTSSLDLLRHRHPRACGPPGGDALLQETLWRPHGCRGCNGVLSLYYLTVSAGCRPGWPGAGGDRRFHRRQEAVPGRCIGIGRIGFAESGVLSKDTFLLGAFVFAIFAGGNIFTRPCFRTLHGSMTSTVFPRAVMRWDISAEGCF